MCVSGMRESERESDAPMDTLTLCHRHHHCAHAAIDGVSELRGDVLINSDTLGIDLTSCCNDLLVFVKDRCLSGPLLMC